MPSELNELIETARNHVMSDEEKRAQVESFAYGNLKLDGCNVTRDDVKDALAQIGAGQKGGE